MCSCIVLINLICVYVYIYIICMYKILLSIVHTLLPDQHGPRAQRVRRVGSPLNRADREPVAVRRDPVSRYEGSEHIRTQAPKPNDSDTTCYPHESRTPRNPVHSWYHPIEHRRPSRHIQIRLSGSQLSFAYCSACSRRAYVG